MVVCEDLVFIEMPRTGSTHTKRLLKSTLGGRSIGMHEPAPADVISQHRNFLGTIRNPWDWYVSQWTIGSRGAGTLVRSATRDAGPVKLGPGRGLHFDPTPWREAYSDPAAADIGAFRQWLGLMFDPDATALAFPGRVGRSDIRTYAGWYSYMYVNLFCSNNRATQRPGSLRNHEDMVAYVRSNQYVTHLARTENLGAELVMALELMGVPLKPGQKRRIERAPPYNASPRPHELGDYYNDELAELVNRRERMIIDQAGYELAASC